jgi:2-hydroxychromene-2-carboxylate isomerase
VTGLPAEAVEAAARALWARRQKWTAWDDLAEYARQLYLDDARDALTAAVPSLREAWETELRAHSSDRVGDLLTDIARITRGVRDV